MNRPVGTEFKYVDIIKEDWNKVFMFIQSSSVLNDIKAKEKNNSKLFQDKISEVQVYRDNSTKAFLEGRERFNSMISGGLKKRTNTDGTNRH